MANYSNNKNLIWIDLEMTGLDPDCDKIIEIATIITNSKLNILAEGPVFAIHQEQDILDNMDEWNTKQHNRSGLIERVKKSEITEADASAATIDFLSQYIPAGKSPMCGNSICQDRRFLCHYMPDLAEHFHYRNLDVSSIKELARRWVPHVYKGFKKEPKHLALSDIKDSIEELKYYQLHFFKINNHANNLK